jgi:hypothetical protein
VSKESRAVLPSELLHEPGNMAYSGPMTTASGTNHKPSAGGPLPPKCSVIEVHVGELKQLFNAIDPSPFRDKDLDPKAEEFIVGWAKDLLRDATLALVVDLDREAGLPDEAAVLRDAIHAFFRSTRPGISTASARIAQGWQDQPRNWSRCSCIGDCRRRFFGWFNEGQPYWGDCTGKLYDRRLGFYVAPS